MINDTLKQIEEEFDIKFTALRPDIDGKKAEVMTEMWRPVKEKILEWHKSSITKVLQQLVEREENGIRKHLNFCNGGDIGFCGFCDYNLRDYNQAKYDTISYLKSEIANLSTNIDKE